MSLRWTTSGLGSTRERKASSRPSIGKGQLGRSGARARILALHAPILRLLSKKPHHAMQLRRELDAYETDIRLVLKELVEAGTLAKFRHGNSIFFHLRTPKASPL